MHTYNTKDVKEQILQAQENIFNKLPKPPDESVRKAVRERINKDFSHWSAALFTYTATQTDNVLDYFNKGTDYAIWYWQWRLIWNKLRERNRD
ncbi:MAG: hypothetical protein LBV47_05400 [Bacteroidales bacterium]|jgi:translation elongation factor EF-Ts|nr:hypothetical protein [Bacteroidales bacterium]